TKNTFLINDPSPVDGFSPFLHACYFGKLDYVTLFASGDKAELEQQVSKSSSNYYGYTPLLLAAVRGYKDVYNYLKKAGCNEKACGNDGWNLAFILVAKKDKIDKDGKELEILLNEHPEFMLHKTSFNSNLLHFAVQYKNEKLFTYLSAQYPQFIHALNNDCDSPMHKAIASQNKNALEIMKRYGGIPNTILNADKSNYLFCALQTGDKAIVDICITPELINAIDQKTGLTPLAWSIKEKRNDLIAALLKKGADPKIVDQTGATALDLAVIGENKEGFDLIVPFYDEIEVRHILQIAVDKKDYFFTKLLAKMPQQKITHTLNSSFKDADCFLQYAIQKKLLSKIKIALTYGLNPNEPFSNGTLPLHFATLHGNKEIIEILTSKTYCSNPASVHAVDNHGRNALMLAALHGDADLVDYLLSRQINAQTKDSHGQTLLHFAAQSANVKVLNKVLKLGINIDTQDNDGNSPLLIATSYANTKGIQILVQHKANIELLNNKGDDVISLLKNHENKASFFDKNNFETVRFDIERQKLDLIKARADLKHLYSNVLALQQQNCQLLSQLQSNASGSHYIYQPAQLSTILQDLSVLSQDQIKDETKKLIAHKQQEEKEYQRLFLFWQQIQPYTQPSYQSAGSSSPEPSAPPMTAEEMAKYQAELNKTFSNNQQWSQAPQENNQSYPPYQNAYHAYGNHH
ncbi:MAG TPA: ankyrin repeat domain-containing protein, partial [Patescibacteria group bacterium]|nr:ankyrin repeat domain-containing protein [Patescibacteria group bacterium]